MVSKVCAVVAVELWIGAVALEQVRENFQAGDFPNSQDGILQLLEEGGNLTS